MLPLCQLSVTSNQLYFLHSVLNPLVTIFCYLLYVSFHISHKVINCVIVLFLSHFSDFRYIAGMEQNEAGS